MRTRGSVVASENGTLLFGTPAAPRYARLSQRTVEGVVRDVFHVRKAETVIGRESGDIVFTRRSLPLAPACRDARARRDRGRRTTQLHRSPTSARRTGPSCRCARKCACASGDHFRIGQQLFRFDT